MPHPLAIAPELVRQEWQTIQSWSDARAAREAKRFMHHQEAVAVYVYAMLEEHGLAAANLGLQLVHALDRVYCHAMQGAPAHIGQGDMETAADETYKRFEELIDVEPELSFRRTFFQRDLAAPEVLIELLGVMMEVGADDPDVTPSLPALFMTMIGAAKAYERAHGLAAADVPKSSLGEVIEARTGRPIPKIGRHDPCPCGSGAKFKKCCGHAQDPPPPPQRSRAEELFSQHLRSVEQVWAYLHERKRDRDAQWLRKHLSDFEQRYRPGQPGGVPDSMYLNDSLFDVVIPQRGKTMGELFLERQGHALNPEERRSLQHLCNSYNGFYEVAEITSGEGKKRLRELVSGTEWLVNDIEDPHAQGGEPGEIWLSRLVGPCDDAVTLMSPLIYPTEMRADLEDLVRTLMEGTVAGGLPVAQAMRMGMKEAGEALADFVLATSPDLDEDDDEDDEWDEEDWDDDDGDEAS